MANPLPLAVLFGVYLGIVTGIVPALVAWTLGFLFRYVVGVTIPGFGVLVLGISLAGVNGGLLALADPTIVRTADAPAIVTALLVVMMLTLAAHARGDALGATLPRGVLDWRSFGERTLSTDLADVVRNEVTITASGPIRDVEGAPPLPAPTRSALRTGQWRLPADLPVAELEQRLTERLRTDHDLDVVEVTIDERGQAAIAAAPASAGVSRRLDRGQRAVSIDGVMPTGLARGDGVTVRADGVAIEGTVVSARSTTAADDSADAAPIPTTAPTTDGGEGQVTVAVGRSAARRLRGLDRGAVVVRPQGETREYELLSVLRRAGQRVQRITADETTTVGALAVTVLAVETADGWAIVPPADHAIPAGRTLFVTGSRGALEDLGVAHR